MFVLCFQPPKWEVEELALSDRNDLAWKEGEDLEVFGAAFKLRLMYFWPGPETKARSLSNFRVVGALCKKKISDINITLQ